MIPKRSSEPSGGSTPDEALVLQVARGNEAAFEQLYDRFAPQVFGLVSRLMRDEAHNEEVTQKIFVDAWQHAASFDPRRTTALTWLLTIAHRCAVDQIHSTPQCPEPDLIIDARTPQESDHRLEDGTAFQNEGERMTTALRQLTKAQREAIQLAYFGGLTHCEIAEHLQLPVGTVQSGIRDGMKKLRDLMGVA
ncbi:RNA polymerase subunit sigma [Glutamicibacter soli]|uniref:RNA polymerase subunit sigma n=1 Tax=Glutamicibacter soli TaxID=453836 RepID=A0A365Y8B7_9MICC|nr:sigma-70 family RNA polymerase sigma factor [Glutamicibacter soli]RBL98910.1 RNA polymerase subunit sigma [Glutamicibacter soli]